VVVTRGVKVRLPKEWQARQELLVRRNERRVATSQRRV
jgi:hypothetical protein